jgi:argininosuccinate lyase
VESGKDELVAKQAEPKPISGPVWGRRIAGEAGKANVAYCAGWDVRSKSPADLQLLPYDLWTNRAHCAMLCKVGVIPKARLRRILKALDALEALHREGKFALRPELEDVHLNVETFVEQQEGLDVAGLMHTARSRNDQVATDMRLYLRDRLLEFIERVLALADQLRQMAQKHARTLMPGLTHHQPAAWTTFGHWASSHAFAFARDARVLLDLLPVLNVSPLGAAASFGTSWPIDRALTARLLGFDRPQDNTLDAVTNRTEFDARVASAVSLWAAHAATLSQDLILFSSPPWHLMRIGDAYVTGSSIMPQKRNPDFAEVTKAKASLAGAMAATLLDLTRGDPSGYNREQQWSKYLIMDLFSELGDAPLVLTGALQSLQLDKERMRTLMAHDYLEAADVADYLAQSRQVPFRKAYRWLGEAVRRSEEEGQSLADAVNQALQAEKGVAPLSAQEAARLSSPDLLVAQRASQGGPSPEAVGAQCADLRRQIQDLQRRRRQAAQAVQAARRRLDETLRRLSR